MDHFKMIGFGPAGMPIKPMPYQAPAVNAVWRESFKCIPTRCLYCQGWVTGRCALGIEGGVYDNDTFWAHEACRVMEILSGKD